MQRQLLCKISKVFNELHPSYLIYAVVVGVICGIVLGYSRLITLELPLTAILISLTLLLLCFIKINYLTVVIATGLGVIIGNIRVGVATIGADYFSSIVNQEITISGVIMEDPNTDKNPTVIKLKNLQILESGNQYAVAGVIYAQIADKIELARSDEVVLKGKVGAGFGTYVAKMFRPKIVQVSRPEPGDVFLKVRDYFSNLVRNSLPSPEADLGLGYLMGMKTGIPDDLLESLQLVGMTHVVVASGAHLGILVNLSKKLFGKISRFAGVMFSILMILGFTMIVGLTPSMSRAALVSMLSLVAGYFGRKFLPVRLILLVAAITLLYDPSNLASLGWQLSFSSFFGILVLAPKITRFLYGGKKPKFIPEMLLTSLSTSLICAPILLYNFGSLSLLSFVANLFILPTLPYAMGLTFLTGITSFFAPLAQSFGLLTKIVLDFHIWIVKLLEDKTTFIITLESGKNYVFWLYLIPAIFLLGMNCLEYLGRKRKLCYNNKYENQFRGRNAKIRGKIRAGPKTTMRD